MTALRVYYHGRGQPILVGRLASKDRRIFFEYDQRFVGLGLELSPIKLPLSSNLELGPATPFKGLHGVFADSLPDGWGLLLMDRHFRRAGIDPRSASQLDRLAYIGDRAMGALSYEPDTGKSHSQSQPLSISLAELANDSIKIIEGSTTEVLSMLTVVGGSPGGARPKAVVGLRGSDAVSGAGDLPDGFSPWLVKFPPGATHEAKEEGVIEYLYAKMATAAGVNMAENQLLADERGNRIFASRRFDRSDTGRRIHQHTLAGMIGADFRRGDSDYSSLIRAVGVATRSQVEIQRAFRAMVFNVLAGNRDDHTKNFSFLMSAEGKWTLAPIYDVTYSSGINGEHSMTIDGNGRDITKGAITKIGRLADIEDQQVQAIIDQTAQALRQWPSLAREHNVSATARSEIQRYTEAALNRLVSPGHAKSPRRSPLDQGPQ